MMLGPVLRPGDAWGLLPERLAVVSHSHPSISKGGAEIAAYALYRGLREIGVDAIFVGACSLADRGRLSLGSPNEFAVFVEAERYDHFFHLALNTLRGARALPGVSAFLTLHEFLAICQNHGQMITRPSQALCERATNEACVACFPEHMRSQFTLRRDAMLDAFGAFDGFVSPSRFLAERFIDWGLAPERVTVIENGLLSPPEAAGAARREATSTFGFFGQINPFKGVDVLLDVADLVAREPDLSKSLRLRIHGNLVGQSEAFTRRFEEALKAHPFLSYAGPYNNASVHRLMGECDYVVIPSKWWENSPVVIQEAYSVGVPVICTGIGGMAEKVRDGVSGLHFRLGDAADLLRAMRIGADPRNAAHLRAGLPAAPNALDMAERYLAFFGSAIAGRRAAQAREPGVSA